MGSHAGRMYGAELMDVSVTREKAGVYICVAVIIAYALIGFLQMIAPLVGVTIPPPPANWDTTMQGLALTGLGFLIGKQTTSQPAVVTSTPLAAAGDTSTTTTVQKTE